MTNNKKPFYVNIDRALGDALMKKADSMGLVKMGYKNVPKVARFILTNWIMEQKK